MRFPGFFTLPFDKGCVESGQTPTIFLARTVLHESVHAYLYSALKMLNCNVPSKDIEFEALYEAFRKKKGWQHEVMADKYVSLIAKGIKEVHPFLGDTNFINDRNTNFPDWDWDKFFRT